MEITFKIVFFVTLAITLIILWKWYWRLQIMYNSSILSLYTPDTFPIPETLKEQYNNTVSYGKKVMSKSGIIITALVRDVAHKLPEITQKAERMGSLFGDYRILIVENDSSDGTREKLLEWHFKNPRVTILGCGYNVDECHMSKMPKTDGHGVDRIRIEKMVKLRNIYLEEIKRSDPYRFQYVAMWDMDLLGSIYFDGVQHTIGYMDKNPDVDVVCAYGIYRWGILTLFYDTYALLHKGEQFHIDMKTAHDIRKGLWEAKYDRGEDPVEVDSCFSGFALYRTSSLLDEDVLYDMSGEDNLECEHVRLNIKIKGKKVVNPSMINFVLLND
jgi:hypothetical protein